MSHETIDGLDAFFGSFAGKPGSIVAADDL